MQKFIAVQSAKLKIIKNKNNIVFSSSFQSERNRNLELWETVLMRHL